MPGDKYDLSPNTFLAICFAILAILVNDGLNGLQIQIGEEIMREVW